MPAKYSIPCNTSYEIPKSTVGNILTYYNHRTISTADPHLRTIINNITEKTTSGGKYVYLDKSELALLQAMWMSTSGRQLDLSGNSSNFQIERVSNTTGKPLSAAVPEKCSRWPMPSNEIKVINTYALAMKEYAELGPNQFSRKYNDVLTQSRAADMLQTAKRYMDDILRCLMGKERLPVISPKIHASEMLRYSKAIQSASIFDEAYNEAIKNLRSTPIGERKFFARSMAAPADLEHAQDLKPTKNAQQAISLDVSKFTVMRDPAPGTGKKLPGKGWKFKLSNSRPFPKSTPYFGKSALHGSDRLT